MKLKENIAMMSIIILILFFAWRSDISPVEKFPKSGVSPLDPTTNLPCNQSATTTPCETLETIKAGDTSEPAAPNVVYSTAKWSSATHTPITFSGYTFQLPPGWHGEVYEKGFGGGFHALIQSELSERGFTIDCPPDGKGLEAAKRLTSDERTFTANSITYSAVFEEWAAPGNDPWFFVWIKSSAGDSSISNPRTACLAQGSANPAIKSAMQTLYETIK
jgi:hypothetical protein